MSSDERGLPPIRFVPLEQVPVWKRASDLNWQYRANICGEVFKQHFAMMYPGGWLEYVETKFNGEISLALGR